MGTGRLGLTMSHIGTQSRNNYDNYIKISNSYLGLSETPYLGSGIKAGEGEWHLLL